MSRIEELPDDFNESLNLNHAPAPITSSASLEELYEKRLETPNAMSSKSFEDIMYDMSKTPLFMNSLDVEKSNNEDGQNDMLEAIKALQYEGTKAEVVQGFKEQGNGMVKEKRWTDAKQFYTKGIAVLTAKGEDKWDKPVDFDEEARQLRLVEEQIYVNRALCNLELKNYRSTTLDCAAALKVNPSNVKAHYRSASALLALNKVHEALDVCYRGLKADGSNAALKKLHGEIQIRSNAIEQQDRRRRAEQKRREQEKKLLETALEARQIRVRGSERPPDLEDAAIRLSPDPLSPTSLLEFPLMLLYPMHNQSDFIKAAAEKNALSDHLSYILPLPWDTKGEYKMANVDCYMDTVTGGLMKVGKKLTLLEILSNGKTEIVDGLVRVYVVPTSLASEWIEDVKKKKGK